jgi:hypothetical protein
MSIRTVSVAVFLLFVACDEPVESGASHGKAATPTNRDGPPLVVDPRPGTAAGPDDRAAYSSCLLGCDDATVARADKAACRMNCEQPADSVPSRTSATAVDSDPVEYVAGCMGRCYSDGKRSESCSSACKTAVAGMPAAPTAGVLDTLGTCLDTCHTGKQASETNQATCALNCTQSARVAGPAPATSVKR